MKKLLYFTNMFTNIYIMRYYDEYHLTRFETYCIMLLINCAEDKSMKDTYGININNIYIYIYQR